MATKYTPMSSPKSPYPFLANSKEFSLGAAAAQAAKSAQAEKDWMRKSQISHSQASAAAAQNNAAAQSAPAASYSYGGGGGGVVAAAAPAAPVAPRLSDDEWLAQNSEYNGQLAALDQKLKDFEVENASSKKKGTQDYHTGLDRMGWIRDKNTWDAEDRSKAYGSSYQRMQGDFASRGLMQSTLYDQERTNLLADFTRQKTEMDTNQTNFLEDLARALSQQQTNTRLSKDQARVDALARRAASESGVS